MIKPFPEEWELLSFFECEPSRKDTSIPWAYDRLSFSTERGQDSIHCDLEIDGFLEVSWRRDGMELAQFQTTLVRALHIESQAGVDKMIAYLDAGHERLVRFEVQIKPSIRFYMVAVPSPEL